MSIYTRRAPPYPSQDCIFKGRRHRRDVRNPRDGEGAAAVAGHTWCLSFLRYAVVVLDLSEALVL